MDEGSNSGQEGGRRESGQQWHPAPGGTGSGSDLDIESGEVEPKGHCSLEILEPVEVHNQLKVEVGVDHKLGLEGPL